MITENNKCELEIIIVITVCMTTSCPPSAAGRHVTQYKQQRPNDSVTVVKVVKSTVRLQQKDGFNAVLTVATSRL